MLWVICAIICFERKLIQYTSDRLANQGLLFFTCIYFSDSGGDPHVPGEAGGDPVHGRRGAVPHRARNKTGLLYKQPIYKHYHFPGSQGIFDFL